MSTTTLTRTTERRVELCRVCKGRGEVAAGITTGIREFGPSTIGFDWRGNQIESRCCEPTGYDVNPKALDRKINDVWLLETNPHGKL